jgi:hypothetical protein
LKLSFHIGGSVALAAHVQPWHAALAWIAAAKAIVLVVVVRFALKMVLAHIEIFVACVVVFNVSAAVAGSAAVWA